MPQRSVIRPILYGYVNFSIKELDTPNLLIKNLWEDVIDDFGTASSMTSLPQSQLCSWCYTNMFQTWQSSLYSVYNEMYEEAYVYIADECGLDVSTNILPAIVIPPTQPTAMCLSDINYIIQSGDTCDSIAMTYNVTSAAILSGNPNSVFNCSGLIPENKICMPLTCGPLYEIQDEDTCSSIESSYGLSLNSLRQYNPWITFGCDNLQEAREILGSMICLGPQAGEFTNTTNTIPGASSSPSTGTGYSLIVMPPPDNSTVADGTTTYCGTWYTAAANDTCASICVQQSIPSALFLQCNPSLSSVDCDSSLVLGTTYCVSANYAWNDTTFWNDDSTSSTTTTSAPSSSAVFSTSTVITS